MDKIVKHRFWILLALVPPLVVFGYYKANGAIKDATTARISALDTALNNIPKGDGPNPTWVSASDGGIEIYNAAIKKAVDVEKVSVWTDQLPRMTWPPEMEPYVPRTPEGDMIYRGEFPREAGFTYKAEYNDQLEALYQSIEPLKQTRDGVTGKVQLSRSAVPRHSFPPMLVASELIWDAQEDLWLLQLLFDAIRNTNRPAENAAKSAVRRLSYIRLMGGDGQSTIRSMGGVTGAVGDGRGLGGDEAEPTGMMMRNMGPAGMGAMGSRGTANVSFDPSEEFGIGFEGAAGGALAGGDEAFAGLATGRADRDDDLSGAVGAVGGGFGQKEIRYIQYQDGALFRERGFYMSVLIDQKKIADFLVELSNSDWPIRIVRFNVGPNGGATGLPMGVSGALAGRGEREDTDDLGGMFSGRGAMGFNPLAGGFNPSGFGSSGGLGDQASFGGQGGFSDPGFSDDLFNDPLMGGNGDELDFRGMGAATGAYGPSPLVRGDQIQSLFTHPDLVQMDLCGVITMYNPPPADLYAAVTGKPAVDAAATAPAEGTDSSTGEAAAAAEPAAGAETLDPTGATPDAGDSPDAATAPDASASEGTAPVDSADTPAESPAAETPAGTSDPPPGN